MIEIIAEGAQGYAGDPSLAAIIVRGAAAAGADAVKLQLVIADELAVPGYEYYERYLGLEMPEETWAKLVSEAHTKDTRFYVDVFGQAGLQMAKRIGVDGVKIHASDFNNTSLIAEAASTFDTVFVSVGGAADDEIIQFSHAWDQQRVSCRLVLLYGFQSYPTPLDATNLNRIQRVKDFGGGLPVGFMDHVDGASDDALVLPAMALALGAEVLEKHITLDHSLELIDHWSALTIDRFALFVSQMRRLEAALGDPSGDRTEAEAAYQASAGKVLVAVRELEAGTHIQLSDVALKRVPETPAKALVKIEDGVGRVLQATVREHMAIESSHLRD